MTMAAPQTQVLATPPATAMSSSPSPPFSCSQTARHPGPSARSDSDANASANTSTNNRTSTSTNPSHPVVSPAPTKSPRATAAAVTVSPTFNPTLDPATTTPTTATSAFTVPTTANNTTNNAPNNTTKSTTSTITTSTATSAPRPIPASSSKTAHSGISDFHRSTLDLSIGLIIPPPEPSTFPSYSSVDTSSYSSSLQTPIESLRRHPTDLTTPIPEECDEETCSESLPNDPVTPVSGRQSRDFRFCDSHEFYRRDSVPGSLAGASIGVSEQPDVPLGYPGKDYLRPVLQPISSASAPATDDLLTPPAKAVNDLEQSPFTPITPRPFARRSSSVLSRAMSSLFRRSMVHTEENGTPTTTAASSVSREPNLSAGASETSLPAVGKTQGNASRRRFSYHRSVGTTRSNTPPSPGSPLEIALPSHNKGNESLMPTSSDFMENNAKKHRAHTGFSLRQRVNFVSAPKQHSHRRTKSLERKNHDEDDNLTRQPWAIPPDAGTGLKARRLSLSLPDDFNIDVAELSKEYEYHHKFLGRHGRHLGKGATSKVTLMVRKGCPGELYAVKEFRSKGALENADDYEKKIRSEYTIAKSLHHPNIVETVQLCTDHGRWNHVMEYCAEGDLFSLVAKKYLGEEGRAIDRLCLFKQLCQGINYLHTNGIAHRDIKLENLLITKESKLKITDFGVSEVFSGIHPGLRESGGQCGVAMGEVRFCKPGICGSLPYIAPEVLAKKEHYDPRALDVWSSAIVMIYLIFSSNLWEKAEPGIMNPSQRNYNDLVAAWEKADAKKIAKPEIAKDVCPKVPAFEYFVKPLALRRLLLNMLHPDPKKRITMQDVITNRWVKNIECCQLESYDDPVKYIDASKKDCMKSGSGKIYCHNHLPPISTGHGLPPMPGKPGY
ncbi:kinase-like domain-containing protein [Nemania sp. NC0429]|nr:kinase-like domain-containing protein [Nemania sp. NC0429]